MNILAINCGGSSIKFKLFAMPEERVLQYGAAERIGSPACSLCHGRPGEAQQQEDAKCC